MASRLQLHEEFIETLESDFVYFNPPESKKMDYPCIRYSPSEPNQKYANNKQYAKTNRYEGIVIDYDPDSDIPDKLASRFEMFKLGRPYKADNLNHFPFTIYY